MTPILIGDKWNHTHLKSSRETQNFLPLEWENVEAKLAGRMAQMVKVEEPAVAACAIIKDTK